MEFLSHLRVDRIDHPSEDPDKLYGRVIDILVTWRDCCSNLSITILQNMAAPGDFFIQFEPENSGVNLRDQREQVTQAARRLRTQLGNSNISFNINTVPCREIGSSHPNQAGAKRASGL